ncbi:MAG: prepilin peptidase, partial [Betaproteobacteria bacterium]|nr:prepilin peptidase [Betaproteobacteria bacterium]
MDLIDAFRALPWLFISSASILGLMIGSFLNVVIHRLPKMMEADWRQQCLDFLHPDQVAEQAARYNLIVPRSKCPACGHQITAAENIPVISYLAL